MALSFPSSPSVGDTSTQNGRQYTWSGYAWELSSNVAGHASTHASGGSDAVSLAASQITSGTLADARLSANIITASTLALAQNATTSSWEVFPRYVAGNIQTPTSASVYWTFFSPAYSFTASQVSIAVSGASGTVTAAKLGLYTAASDGAVTLVARTASDTSIFASANTLATRSFSTTGGYPATYSLSAGSRYALALFATSSGSMPTVPTVAQHNSAAWSSPRLNAYLTSQSDLPTSVASNGYATSAFNFALWMRIS